MSVSTEICAGCGVHKADAAFAGHAQGCDSTSWIAAEEPRTMVTEIREAHAKLNAFVNDEVVTTAIALEMEMDEAHIYSKRAYRNTFGHFSKALDLMEQAIEEMQKAQVTYAIAQDRDRKLAASKARTKEDQECRS